MEYSNEQLIAMAKNSKLMNTLKSIKQLMASIEDIEFRLESNRKQREIGGIEHFGETQETVDILKNLLATGQWGFCTCVG